MTMQFLELTVPKLNGGQKYAQIDRHSKTLRALKRERETVEHIVVWVFLEQYDLQEKSYAFLQR